MIYIPVIVKTKKGFKAPEMPVTTYPIYDPKLQKVIPVPIKRHFEEDKAAQKKLEKQEKNDEKKGQQVAKKKVTDKNLKPITSSGSSSKGKNPKDKRDAAGYKIKPTIVTKNLAKLPTRFRRVWPVLKADEGSIPKDAILAWEGMKESEFIVNITPPKSPHKDYRWIIFFYVRSSYEITKNKHPLVPFFILADKDFSWVRGRQPEFVPVPLNLLPY